MKTFKRPAEFPNEAFVQKAIERYFIAKNYEIDAESQIDLRAWKDKSENWIIEAKGESKAINTDFNTCIGQLVGHMDNDDTYYAIALPQIDKYKYQCRKLSDFIRKRLSLYIIFVDQQGTVSIINPDESIQS